MNVFILNTTCFNDDLFSLFFFSFPVDFFLLDLVEKEESFMKNYGKHKFFDFLFLLNIEKSFLLKFLTKSKTEHIPDILKKKYLKYYHLFFNLTKGEKLTFLCKDFFQKNLMVKNFSKEKFSTKLF